MRVTMEKALRAKEEELDKMRRDLLREMEQIQVRMLQNLLLLFARSCR